MKLLKKDMIMTMRGFESRQAMWSYKAQIASQPPGMAEYAARKSDFYRKLKNNIIIKCDKHVKVRMLIICANPLFGLAFFRTLS